MSQRTDEQKRADEQLTAAILAVRNAYHGDDEYLLTDYIVLTAETRFDEHGDQYTAYSRLYRDGDMPWYRILGLLDVHRQLCHAASVAGDDNG